MKRNGTRRGALAAMVLAVGVATGVSQAQLVVGNDAATGQLWVIDVLGGGAGTRQLLSGTDAQIQGLAADNANNILYWTDGGTRLLAAPVVSSGTLTPAVIDAALSPSMTGLAYDSVAGGLFGIGGTTATTEGFYSISTIDGTQTLLSTIATAADLGGFDYDPVTDAFYVTNDSTTFLSGRGLYRVDKPLTAPVFTLVVAYPGGDTDVDGFAINNGRAYLVNDTTAVSGLVTNNVNVYNLGTGMFEADIAAPYTTNGTFSGGTWATNMIATSGANVGITVTDFPDPLVVPPGGSIVYTVNVTNFGPDPANDVNVSGTLPGNVTFSAIDPPGMHSAGNITAAIGTLGVGASTSFTVTVVGPGVAPDTVNFTLNVSSTTPDPSAANNSATATTTIREPLANLGVAITDPGDCSVGAGQNFAYTVNVTNASGQESATNTTLAFTLPSVTDATFVSSVPAGVPSGGVLTLNLGTIISGGSSSVTINMTALTASASLASSAVVSADQTDPTPANNTDSETTLISPTAPTEAPIKGIFHDYAALAGSDVPGLPGVKFSSFDRPFVSPDRSKIIQRVDTDAPTTSDGMMLVFNGSWSVVAREGDPIAGVTPAVAINQIDDVTGFDELAGINNAGNYAYSGNFEGTASDDFVVKNVGGVNTLVCDEDATSAAFIGGGATTFNDVTGNVTIAPDNRVTWHGTLNGAPTANDTVLVRDDGTVVLIQEGITVPTNQFSPGPVATTSPWSGTINSAAQTALSFNAGHTSWLAMGTLGSPTATTNDEIAAVNLDVKVQEDIAVNPPFTDLVLDIDTVTMAPNGDWYIHGDNDGGQDFIVRNGEVIAQTDQPVPGFPGEFYDDTLFTACFFMVAGNASGDYVFGAVTNNPDLLEDAVLVYNGTTVIARQNDPVDLNNDGVFNDDAYIRTFNDHNIFLTETDCYVTVTLRNSLAALCGGSDTQSGDAFIRIPLPVVNDCPLDLSGNETVDADDIFAFLSFWFDGPPGGTCSGCIADWNDDGMITADDIFAYLSDWFAFGPGMPCP